MELNAVICVWYQSLLWKLGSISHRFLFSAWAITAVHTHSKYNSHKSLQHIIDVQLYRKRYSTHKSSYDTILRSEESKKERKLPHSGLAWVCVLSSNDCMTVLSTTLKCLKTLQLILMLFSYHICIVFVATTNSNFKTFSCTKKGIFIKKKMFSRRLSNPLVHLKR